MVFSYRAALHCCVQVHGAGDEVASEKPPMESEEYRVLYEAVKKKGSDFYDIAKDPQLQKYSVEDLEDAYVHIMDHIRFLCPESGGCEEIKQIKDVYRIGGDIFFDIYAEDSDGKKVEKKEVFVNDYRSKFFTLVKDYKYFLMGKLNMIREIERGFKERFEDICSESSES